MKLPANAAKSGWTSAIAVFLALSCVSCSSSAVRAEEYYALGTAYFDLKKYDEAGRWFEKAKFHRKTRDASEYNLGRIAYERGKYEEAARYFDRILKRDPENITALKAAAYSSIKTGDLEKASFLYGRVIEMVPESHDDGYNYAMVLLALDRNEEAEAVLVRHNNTESAEALFLLARAQKKQGKPEAADAFAGSLAKNSNPWVRMEYGEFLEEQGLYAKAMEEYKQAETSPGDIPPAQIRFRSARVLIKEPRAEGDQGRDGLVLLKEVLAGGFSDEKAFSALLADEAVPEAKKGALKELLQGYIKTEPVKSEELPSGESADTAEPQDASVSETEVKGSPEAEHKTQ